MKKTQLVKIYENIYEARGKMDESRMFGWLVHTCAFSNQGKVLVVYEKESQ